ncbi:hypothetical protein [Achromobacter agilis]|uniref:Pentapeptide repeat-containing protein n=1 Tax=Achromobacter agilis TaxID=1353888 RepID=A0A446CFB9_9BURK|nr:hypothetical protein [Achromobacter agilis]SSW66567.1 hypothetical protein AGI3411_02662 [Achromobacter agilis]
MKTIEGATFKLAFDKGNAQFRDLHVHDCAFDNCSLSMVKYPGRMSRVQNVRLSKCRAVNSMIKPCVFDDVVVEDLSTNPILLGLRCLGVPLHLIKRDPQTQIILDKQGRYPGHQALDKSFAQAFPLADSVLRGFDASDEPSLLLAASLAAPKARREEEKGAIAELRRLGFVEE